MISEILSEVAGELVLIGLMGLVILLAHFFPIPEDKTFEEIDNEIKNK